MANLDTQQLWLALGSFYTDYFPDSERRYWDAYWESFADISADLWGFAYQIDQSRDVFTTPATLQRLNVMLNPVLQEQMPSFTFQLAEARTSFGITTVRGFVPRDGMSFKARDIPNQGLIRIGTDNVNYIAVNIVTVASGPLAGYVTEAVFTLDSTTRNYADSLPLGDSFNRNMANLVFRVPQSPGQTFIDATSNGAEVAVDPTGLIEIGTAGFDREVFEYQSVTRIGDRYVFNLATTARTPGPGVAPSLGYPHAQGQRVVVSRLTSVDGGRWVPTLTGPIRLFGDNAACVSIDNLPSGSASTMTLADTRIIDANTDFDLEVTLLAGSDWRTPAVDSTSREAGFRIDVGGQVYELAFRTSRSSSSVIAESLVATGPSGSQLRMLSSRPGQVALRLARTGNRMEALAKTNTDNDYRVIAQWPVSGQQATMSLFAVDGGTDIASAFRFDEVIRRLGTALGNQRQASSFLASERLPYRYSIDVNVASAPQLQEEPKVRRQYLAVVGDGVISKPGGVALRCAGTGDDFFPQGVPPSGVVVAGGKSFVYDACDRIDSKTFDFFVRGDRLPVDWPQVVDGLQVEARTRTVPLRQFSFQGDSTLWLRDPPTRGQLWVPIAEVDEQLIQKLYGPLVSMDSVKSTESYQRRVQGAWYALTMGPAIENIRIGIHLALGLPAAKEAGVVTEIATRRDKLGVVTARTLTINGPKGTFVHNLNPKLPAIWSVGIGDRVERFEPLTRGVEVLDVDSYGDWGKKFGGNSPKGNSLERWRSFGVLADISSLGDEASLLDAIRFALRIKPVEAKLFFSFTMGDLGVEELTISDDSQFTQTAEVVEDISFDEGVPSKPVQEPLQLGRGHKMGQHKHLGSNGPFRSFPQLGVKLQMGTGLYMDMEPRAWVGPPGRDGHAREELTITPVTEVES